MSGDEKILASIIAIATLSAGTLFAPAVLANRITPLTTIGGYSIAGVSQEQLPGALEQINQQIGKREVTLKLNEKEKTYTLAQLGVQLDTRQISDTLSQTSLSPRWIRQREISPVVFMNEKKTQEAILGYFSPSLQLPVNASLTFTPTGQLEVTPSRPGDTIDILALEQDLRRTLTSSNPEKIEIRIVSAAAEIQENETQAAQELAQRLLANGFTLRFNEETFTIKASTLRRILEFVPRVDPTDSTNQILGVQFNPEQLQSYLETTLAPEINQEAINARFELQTENTGPDQNLRVTQFAVPQTGQELSIEETITHAQDALLQKQLEANVVVNLIEPDVHDIAGIEALGISKVLATGVSDFKGSPPNRVHNIRVGASRYHGLLVPPGEEFSFNEYLGPVTGEAGFRPELVIKENVTIPEFGGGLCQVSTTAFRAALHSGLEITERRNHSYAVSYYGTPGFDATIYPGHTDLRFLNNTPGYILIQTRIEGTKLIFDFWGTDDGRKVEVAGPTPYNRQPDGAVKATLKQVVTRDGEVVTEESFFSNYKSPKLFPKVLSANGEQPPKPNDTPTPTPTPSPAPQDKNQDSTTKATPTPPKT